MCAIGQGPRMRRLIMLDPGHFHAAQLHNTMLPGILDETHVYAPLGPDVTAYMNTVARYNARPDNPTRWSLLVYAGPDYLERMLREPPGNVVMLSGRNMKKMDYIIASVRGGQNVLADKPWIIESRDLPKLETALRVAREKNVIVYDAMTQRCDVAYQLQRDLVSDRSLFGDPDPGTPGNPAVRMTNKHALLKMTDGVPNHRPAWYFDIRQQGEGVADVGTHLVDLVFWTLFADRAIDYHRDVQVISATRYPTVLSRDQFERVTGEKAWPEYLRSAVKNDRLDYFTNNRGVFTVRGVHVAVDIHWDYEAAPGERDSYFASYRGTRSTVELHQGAEEHYLPEVSVISASEKDQPALRSLLESKIAAWSASYPGLSLETRGKRIHLVIPPQARTPDDRYFSLVIGRFLTYVRQPASLPAWENPNLIAKYYVTTRLVDVARETAQ